MNPAAAHSTLPVSLANGPKEFHRRPAPLLGEHNHELLAKLGLGDDEITALAEHGVIGTEPGAAKRVTR